jgi:hypothetical protein
MVYNGLRVSGLKNSVWTKLLWASPSRGNWNDIPRNPFAWVNQNVALNTIFLQYTHSKLFFRLLLTPSHFTSNPRRMKETFWNSKRDRSSSCLFNFAEIKCYIFNFFFRFCFFSYLLCWFRVCNTFLLCFFMIFSSLVAYFWNLNFKGWSKF